MISTVTLTFDLTYRNPATGALEPRGIVKDSTDYAGLGIDLLITEAKGLGVITFNGDVIIDKNIIADPIIDLQNWDDFNPGVTPVFYFPLELDLNGNVANGIYTFQYSLRLNSSIVFLSITLPSTALTDGTPYVNFFEAGNELTMVPSDDVVTIVSVGPEAGGEYTITLSGLQNDTDGDATFDITNLQLSGVYTYSGCTQTTADVSFTYDCEVGDSGSWSVSNTTTLASNELISTLNCTVSYPSWTALTPTFNPQVVLTSLPYPSAPNTPTPLATGTYTVSLTQQILQTQTDGLILQYSTSTIQEFVVSCSGSLCGLTPCIESLRVAHANELQRNRISKYQVFVDNVLLYYAEAQNYRACGDTANYRATLDLIKANLDSSGCECACCDDNVYYWVSNNSGVSVIDSLVQSFQFRLFDGIPGDTEDVTQGVQVGALWQDINTGYLYRCTVNDPGEAVWEEYYAPGGTPTAAEIPAEFAGHAILTAATVQGQLDQADLALENIQNDAIYFANNGLTKVANDARLGGDFLAETTIDVQGFTFRLNSEGDVNRFALLAGTNQIQIGQYGGGVLTGTPVYGLGVEADGKVIEVDTINTASNGLTKVDSDVQLGGDQTADVTIDKQGFAFKINSEGDANRFAVLGTNQIQIGNYGGNVFPGDDATYALGVDVDGNVVELPLTSGPLVYVATIDQSGTGIPTATVVSNTTGQTITWEYLSAGVYRCNSTGTPFTIGKTVVFINYGSTNGDFFAGIQAFVNTSNRIVIATTGMGPSGAGPANFADNLLVAASFKIEIYP